MALLSDNERFDVWAGSMRRGENFNLLKVDLRAAVNAVDQWVDDNATSFNQALPLTARTNLTAAQKALLLMLVVAKRFEVS